MGATQATGTDAPQADAAAQRHRGMGDDAQDGLGAIQPTLAVKTALAPLE